VSIDATKALYIKLGEGGEYERECITQEQTLRVGWPDVPLDLCRRRAWKEVKEILRARMPDSGALTRDAEQLRLFCEADEKVLWVTFSGNHLWWCFAGLEVEELPDHAKIRRTLNRWSSSDIKGNPLDTRCLSGKLLSMQGFRGTICRVKEFDYLLHKINGEEIPEVIEARQARTSLEKTIEAIIRGLYWKDFEVLIDLIFRQAGWQRVSMLGEVQKTLDLDLLSPVTRERYGVQIKSTADAADFQQYQHECKGFVGFTRFYFAVHTPAGKLTQLEGDGRFELLLPDRVARLAIQSGLVDWIIAKAG
jgi:hypothetical protein